MDETAADRLAIAGTQLDVTTDRLNEHGITVDDLPALAAYLSALADHCYQVAARALGAAENANPAHPVRDVPHGADVQAALGHTLALMDAAQHFIGDVEESLRHIDPDS